MSMGSIDIKLSDFLGETDKCPDVETETKSIIIITVLMRDPGSENVSLLPA